MSGVAKKLMGTTAAGGGGPAMIEDVFSTYLYTGNSSTQTITNGIDLAGEGGLVWIKARNAAINHYLYDTERGATKELSSNLTDAEATALDALTSFNSDGFSLGADNGTNKTSNTHASWTFRKAPRFFDCVEYTGDGTTGRQIPHNLGVIPGAVIAKRTDSSGSWGVHHRSLPDNATGLESKTLFLNLTSDAGNYTFLDIQANQTSTYFQINRSNPGTWNIAGATYVAYLFAHDPLGPSEDGSDGLIACGSTGGGKVTLGWEPQWILHKSSNFSSDWSILDVQRGMPWGQQAQELEPHTSDAEALSRDDVNAQNYSPKIHPDGFELGTIAGSHIYIAIRRGPMRAPESGTEVFATEYMGETLPNPPQWNSGFPVDWGFYKNKDVGGTNWLSSSRLTQGTRLAFNTTGAESALAELKFDYMDGWQDASSVRTDIHGWMFRRAPNFFDVVAYTGTGANPRSVTHNLKVPPELLILKSRQNARTWRVSVPAVTGTTQALILNSTTGAFSSTEFPALPTETTFTIDSDPNINANGENYIAYLFATLAGVSKVGSYTGNGSSQTINCGFTTGARFILIKRTDAAGDWYVWDTARGIVTGNDPHLSLNTTAAEVTTDDSIDPDSSGFIVNQVAATNVNVSSASYIFYAIA